MELGIYDNYRKVLAGSIAMNQAVSFCGLFAKIDGRDLHLQAEDLCATLVPFNGESNNGLGGRCEGLKH
jgi:hypothetical protein